MNNNEYDQEPLTYDEIKPAHVAIEEGNEKTLDELQLAVFDMESAFVRMSSAALDLYGVKANETARTIIKESIAKIIEKARIRGWLY